MRKYRLIALGVAVTLLAAACQSAPPPTAGAGLAQSDAADLQPLTAAPESAQEAAAQAPPTGAPEESEAQSPTVELTTPVEVRQGLAATDPATVDLASGSPTLVEFFAFW